jgi:hypothetical protein
MYLFPNKFKSISGWIFIVTVLFGSYYIFFTDVESMGAGLFTVKVPAVIHDDFFSSDKGFWIYNNIFDELLTILIILSGFIYGFSKEKIEDEFISKMRSDSLAISLYINFGILVLATIFVYGLPYLNVMMIQLFSILVFFNLIFTWRLRKHYNTELNDEE